MEESSRVGRRRLLKATGGGAVGLSLAGCLDAAGPLGIGETDEGPIRIGVLAPRPDRDLIGISTANGAQLGAEELNDAQDGDNISGLEDRDSFEDTTEFDIDRLEEVHEESEQSAGLPDEIDDVELDMDGLTEDGILGREVEVLVRDTKGNPSEARRQYQNLVIEENVDVTMGIFWAEALNTVIEDVAVQQVPHITVGSASSVPNELIEEDYERYKYHFRLGPFSDRLLIENQIDFMGEMRDELGWDQAAILTEGYQWAEEIGPGFDAVLEPTTGIEVVGEPINYPPATQGEDFLDIYHEVIDDLGADVIIAGMSHTGDDAILQWAADGRRADFSGIHIPAQRPDYHGLEAIDGAVEGAIGQTIATDTMRDDIPIIDSLLESYTDRFDGQIPMFTGYSAYTAVLLYATVVEAAGTTDPEIVVPALESVHFDSPTGPIQFYPHAGDDADFPHDPRYGEDFIQGVFFQWQDGAQEVIWPERFATAEYRDPGV